MPRRRTKKQPLTLSSLLIIIIALGAWAFFEDWPSAQSTGEARTPTPAARQRTDEPGPGVEPTAERMAVATKWQIFFTTPTYPDRRENREPGIDTELVTLINSAQRTVDMAIYDFDLENVARAMAEAARRGVQVRMVTDTDTIGNKDERIQQALNIVQAADILIVDDRRSPIMHDKFVIVDEQTVLTGSWNFTEGDTYRLNNNMVIFGSPLLADNYTVEFERMWEEGTFGPNKQSGVPNARIELDGAVIETYFAPQDRVAERIMARLREAKTSIDFMAFSFTSDQIAEALLDLATDGVQVRGVVEKTGSETEWSEYGTLQQAGIEVYQDGSPYVMHHKVFIIDQHTVIFGSYNFSDNADRQNDENLLIVTDPHFAAQFQAEFGRMRELARNPITKR